ncbi:MAG: methyltransferase domain-containing protein [Pseudomonadota bacterium]
MLATAGTDSASHYDAVAEAWGYLLGSSLHYGCFPTGEESLEDATRQLTGRMLARLDGLGADARVLDVGCGTGAPAAAIARAVGCEVTGISPSQACVALANAGRPPELARLLRFEPGDAQAMRFGDHAFDAAWVMESSHLMLDKRRLFAELGRVVKPAGRIVLCDIMQVTELGMKDVMRRRDDFLLLSRVFGRAIMRTPDFYLREARDAGFAAARIEDLTAPTAPTFAHWERNALAHRGAVVDLIGEPAWAEFVASTRILAQLWREGVLGYFMLDARRGAPAQTKGRQAHADL